MASGCYRSVVDDFDLARADCPEGVRLFDVRDFRRRGVRWDSEELKEWWARVEAGSCLPRLEVMDWKDWQFLMEILIRFDVSRIEKIYLEVPQDPPEETIPQVYRFGDVVLAAEYGFAALKTLVFNIHSEVRSEVRSEGRLVGSGSLAKALRSGVLRNLRSLGLEYSGALPPDILEALVDGDVPNFTSLLGLRFEGTADVTFQSPFFRKLRGLVVKETSPTGLQSFARALRSGNLSNITDFRIHAHGFLDELGNIEDIVEWFSCLKYFGVKVFSTYGFNWLFSALRKAPTTEFAWKHLVLSEGLSDSALQEVVGLVDSGRLPHLDTLHLRLPSKHLLTLIQCIGRGSLPSLQRLDWTYNGVDDATLEAIVEAYYGNTSLTVHIIGIKWSSVSDSSLRTKLETYRDRNEKLLGLVAEKKLREKKVGEEKVGEEKQVLLGLVAEKVGEEAVGEEKQVLLELVAEKLREEKVGEEVGEENQVEDLRDLVPLTSARVFICGYPEVGKTTLRKTLLRHFEKCPEVENGAGLRKSPEGESRPEVGQTPAVECGSEVRPSPDVEGSSELVRTAARKPFRQRFGKWGCSCLGTTLSATERASPSEERSLPNEEPTLPSGGPKLLLQEPQTRGIDVGRIEGASPSEERSLPNEKPTLPSGGPNLFHQEPRTRGIEVSRIEGRSNGQTTTLVLWDLAGQQEYHVLHSAFLADRGLISGKATTFILVFDASFDRSVRRKLFYWLQMVAFSSPPGVKRHVIIVLNRFEGKVFNEDIDAMPWRGLIEDSINLFGELNVHSEPFFIDVRKLLDVQELGNHLFDTAQDLLKGLQVPRIVCNLQMELKGWSEREENKGLPILTWKAFQSSWKFQPTETVEDLDLAASILHEIGEIIYLNQTIVVPNPEWFCKNVVGELLLPEIMFEGDNILRKLVEPDGSMEIATFQAYFKKLLVGGTNTDDVVSMLDYIGLCYKRGEKHLVVPALILVDDYSSIGWNGQRDEAMGRSFTVNDQEWNNADQEQKEHDGQEVGRKSFIPAALFQRLQVELAHNEDFGYRADGKYRVGKSFLSCTVGRLLILVQFDVDPSDPIDDRIDILVQIRKGSSNMKEKPVERICQIMDIVEHLCVSVCPGLKYQIKCIEPASASKSIKDMSGRNLMSLKEIKDRIIKGEELSWTTVGGDFVQPETCLSESELNAVVDTVKGRYFACQNDQIAMGIVTIKGASDKGSSSSGSAGDKIPLGSNDQEQIVQKHVGAAVVQITDVICAQADRIVSHIDEKMEELKSELLEFRQKHDRLVKEIQAQRALFISDRVSGVPRYIFLSKKETGSWMSITDAFRSTYHLHFLCEARFDKNDDRRLMHEVEKQDGIELKKPQEWLEKAKPWLLWSLQAAVMVGKTVGNVYLPGIFSLIPDINVLDSDKLAKKVDTAAAQILAEGSDDQVPGGDGGYGTAPQPVKLEEKGIAHSVVTEVKRELGDAEFAEKTRLRRMMFSEPHVTTVNQSQSPVVWICKDCIKKYGNKVKSFS